MIFLRYVVRSYSHNRSRKSGPLCIFRFNASVFHGKGMPWFGMDIGGTLTKCAYFETKSANPDLHHQETELIKIVKKYFKENPRKGVAGQADIRLQMDNVSIGGRTGSVHFIRFPTSLMDDFFAIAKKHQLGKFISALGATGGGAYKFEERFATELNIKFAKFDEMDTLLNGMRLVVKMNRPKEVYYWYNPHPDEQNCNPPQEKDHLSRKEYDLNDPYPFVLVNIGSGVSILAVYGPHNYKRISGSSLGGGTFLGLCCLLTGCTTFEEAIALAAKGDHRKVDKLVRDIYGGDYKKFGLPGDLVASSFGNMNLPDHRLNISKFDLARATLVTITNNIGNIALMWAVNLKISRVVFVGNFLRVNPISAKLLGHAMSFWSRGTLEALFLEHEVRCLLLHLLKHYIIGSS
ncbi:hypothetical protein GE061_015786 [Apolygus lucorum]|uniref:pantothenate kinase n=1 Tax=Apolygus lucorum TaxID=248454 RepID=A0A8S9XP11_APOLU|nr:hypothetical protein GE061_015786 [Apolygus lucorum]